VQPIQHLDLHLVSRAWPFADERRAEIDAYFAGLRQEKPALWNGRVLVLCEHKFDGEALSGSYLEADFASFIAWRDWAFPDRAMRNCFAHAAILSADGAFLLGEMGPHTANAGHRYFPGGTPDPSDVFDGRVELERSLYRELAEETGLTAADVHAEAHWRAVLAEPRIAMMRVLRSPEPAGSLRERILRHIGADPAPELADIHIVRDAGDLDVRVPSFVQSFLFHFWREADRRDIRAPSASAP
jgi:8-oxo-dGTP pyrophosphatase MutT (NUDIX family)